MPVVLTTNEVVLNPEHAWNDITGVQYHYPNQYKNKIRTGEEFVYYRGVRRKDGTRGEAEYFGRGRIGAIRPDPATEGSSRPSWFCDIKDYEPFPTPVHAKLNGVFLETIPQNAWRNGVRSLDQVTFDVILAAAGSSSTPVGAGAPVGLVEVRNLIVPKTHAGTRGGRAGLGYRRSRRAKEIGDWAEQRALEFLNSLGGCAEIVHRAAQGETPGWDIDYRDAGGVLHRVEVKGTVAAAFIDLTANELRAAQKHRDGYWIYLVAGCMGPQPSIQRICHPASLLEVGNWVATPALYSISMS